MPNTASTRPTGLGWAICGISAGFTGEGSLAIGGNEDLDVERDSAPAIGWTGVATG